MRDASEIVTGTGPYYTVTMYTASGKPVSVYRDIDGNVYVEAYMLADARRLRLESFLEVSKLVNEAEYHVGTAERGEK